MAILGPTSVLSILTLISRVLGLVREMVKASLLGTSALSDAFSVAFMIPNLFRRLFAEGSMAVAFIPTFKAYVLEKTSEEIKEFLSSMLTFLTFFVTLAVLLGIIWAPGMVRIFRIQALDETVFLTRLMFPFLGFIALAAFFQGILNSFGIFRPAGFAPIVLNLAIIGGVYLLGPFMANPARAMALGVLIGGFLSGGVQFPFLLKLLKKKGWAFFFVNLKRAFTNPGVKTVVGLIIPTIVGMAAYQLNDLVSTALAGQAGEGVVSSLQYSLRLQELILGVFAVSIGTVLLPDLAGSAKSGQWEVYSRQLGEALNRIALITIPITFFSLVQGETLIRLLFQNRGFGEASVKLTLGAFSFHILGLFFIALNRILAPAFYAQNDSRSPALGGIISFGVNIALAALLAGPLGGPGIALALSLAGLVNTGLLLFFLGRNPRIQVKQVFRKTWRYTGKVTIISAGAILPILGLTPKLLKLWAGPGKLIPYGLPLGVNALVYSLLGILILAWTKDPYIQAFFSFFQSRFSKKKGIKKS